jgi:CRISPR system Cascade subunit CasC
MTNTILDINVLQTVPSSNLNRDDTGAPKTAIYGGVTRSRVSSQSWKRAMRKYFGENDQQLEGLRTKDAAKVLASDLQQVDTQLSEDNALEKAGEVFKAAGIKLDKNNQTGALLLVSAGQLQKLAEYAINHEVLDKKELKKVLKGDQSLDLALFGRMVADNPELNVEGSAQVAHAISTHEIVPEFDYFTAMDDLQPKDNAGAAMLGTVEYNSATLYRYANLNLNELNENLGGENAIAGAIQFVKSFVMSMPSGKQNTFANKTLPSYVLVTVRTDTPVNLVSAFETPISSNNGYVAKSIKCLEDEFTKTLQFTDKPVKTIVLGNPNSEVGDVAMNLSGMLDELADALKKVTADENSHD